jgi:hypothetical protein
VDNTASDKMVVFDQAAKQTLRENISSYLPGSLGEAAYHYPEKDHWKGQDVATVDSFFIG